MRNPRLQRLFALVLVALVVVGALIGIMQSSVHSQARATHAGGASGAAVVQSLFRGIPQHGVALGNPRAPVTLTEFADLQCPFCRQYAQDVLPSLVDRYVRTGKVRLVFRNLAFIGPDSVRVAKVAAAAGLRDRLWQFTNLVYRNQGQENSGYVTTGYLRTVARLAGVDPAATLSEAGTRTVDAQLADAAREASRYGVNETPSFLLARAGGRPTRFNPQALSVAVFTRPIDAALKAG